ncbi:MAG: hypothetical protein GX984_06000 [Erysipelothrix sp.]|nr:hypothetical protein [Erysipelothrix sp.]
MEIKLSQLEPSELFKQIKTRIPNYIRNTFISTFILGLLFHFFMFTNKLPNHDDLGQLVDSMHRANSGRWFQFFPAAISSDFSMPAVNGILAILYISIAATIIVYLFNLKRAPYYLLVSAIMVSFPTIASTFTYMNAADAYTFSLLLACVAVLFAYKHSKFGFLFAIPFITLSLGIYQAYFGVMTALMLSLVILELLENKTELKEIVIMSIKFLFALIMGLVFYMIIVHLAATELTAYMGIDTMGQFNLKTIPSLIVGAYNFVYDFFFENSYAFHLPFMPTLFWLGTITVLGLLVYLVYRNNVYKEYPRLILLIVALVLLPLAANIIYVTAKTKVHLLMIYGLVIFFIFALALIRLAIESRPRKVSSRNLLSLGSIIICLVLLLSTYNYALVSNQAYFKLHFIYEQGYAYANRLISRIEATPGYNTELDIVFIGEETLPPLSLVNNYNQLLETGMPAVTGREIADAPQLKKITGSHTMVLFSNKHLVLLMRSYLGFNQPILSLSYQQLGANLLENAYEMSVYPDDDSIRIVDNQIVVKFSENR